MNLLDLRGPEFLLVYLTLMLLVGSSALLLRYLLRLPAGEPGDSAVGAWPSLDPLEVAFLSGGPQRAADAAIAAAVRAGTLELENGRLKRTTVPASGRAGPLDRYVLEQAGSLSQTVSSLRGRAATAAVYVARRLETLGLVPSTAQSSTARYAPASLLAALFALGVAKILVGLERGRPVGILIALTIIVAITAVVFAAKPIWSSRKGAILVRLLRNQHGALELSATHSTATLEATDLALAMALFGPTVLSGGPMADLHRAMYPPSSSSGGGGCGGGGCGGGGCGGGGCGGCGS